MLIKIVKITLIIFLLIFIVGGINSYVVRKGQQGVGAMDLVIEILSTGLLLFGIGFFVSLFEKGEKRKKTIRNSLYIALGFIGIFAVVVILHIFL